MGKTQSLTEMQQQAPRPNGVGAWAEKLRQAAFDAVKEGDMTDLMGSLMKRAKEGDNNAAKLVLNYLTGGGAAAPQQGVTPEQVGQIVRAAVTEVAEMIGEMRDAKTPRLEDARGNLLGVRRNGEDFEVVGALGKFKTEQEAEAELRRRAAANGNGNGSKP